LGTSSIDLIMVNYKTYDLMDNFIKSYEKFTPQSNPRLIIIDNETNSEKLYKVDTSSATVFPFKENLGYAKACNFGASLSDSDYIAFLNSDTEFINDDCVDKCVEYMDNNPDVAVVGPMQYASDGKITHGGILGSNEKPQHRGWGSKNKQEYRDIQEAVTVSGSAYFTRRKVWEEMMQCNIYKEMFPDSVGAWPPFKHFFEETLYSYHVTAHDYKCVYLGTAEMIHEWHKSSPLGSQDDNFKNGQKSFREFCERHGILHD
jgi:GT2 family glycosyltransferase